MKIKSNMKNEEQKHQYKIRKKKNTKSSFRFEDSEKKGKGNTVKEHK